jgi:hypothetical protein
MVPQSDSPASNRYWRFTPDADPVKLGDGAIGKPGATCRLATGCETFPEDPDNPIYRLAMRQDKKYPIVTWVIAKRSAGRK